MMIRTSVPASNVTSQQVAREIAAGKQAADG
jgi:hypothetical protein